VIAADHNKPPFRFGSAMQWNIWSRPTIAGGASEYSVTTGDFNGDGKIDIASVDRSEDTISIFIGNGNGTFHARTTLDCGGSPS